MTEAAEDLSDEALLERYERFTRAREASIVAEIRRVCGIDNPSVDVIDVIEADEPAGDILAGASLEDEWLELDVS